MDVNTLISLSIVFTPPITRVAESMTTSVRAMDFVESARASGAGNFTIIRYHIVANVAGSIVIYATTLVGVSIIAAAGLSFLGLGASVNEATWGGMLSDAGKGGSIRSAWWLSIFPGVTIVIVVLAWNMLGDGLRDVLDPRLRSA